jgi:hypothetical protein
MAQCKTTCTTTDERVSSCDQGLICTHARTSNRNIEEPFCTRLPIHCSSPDNCPIYRPSSTGDWQCIDEVCRFPGFSYYVE